MNNIDEKTMELWNEGQLYLLEETIFPLNSYQVPQVDKLQRTHDQYIDHKVQQNNEDKGGLMSQENACMLH